MRGAAVMALVVMASALGSSPRAQSAPVLSDVLARLATYLTAYEEEYASTIASEHYTQTVLTPRRSRTLDAEFGIVRLPGQSPWLGFRDVIRVDGQPIQDREGRLARIFEGGTPDGLDQAARITEESTRFNAEGIRRSVNNPALVLELLDARNQPRFRFSKAGEATVGGVSAWIMRGTERTRPTIVRSSNGDNEPANLRAWVDPIAGRLLQAEVTISTATLTIDRGASRFVASITVTFQDDPRLHIWVPAAMRERYSSGGRNVAVGEAIYSNYRRFRVDTQVDVKGRK